MTDPLILRGLTSELEGNEHRLIFSYPVVSRGDDLLVFDAPDDPLTQDATLVPLRAGDREYVRWINEATHHENAREITLDEGIWVVGPALLDAARGIEGLRHLRKSASRWTDIGLGFRATTGTYRAFLDELARFATNLEIDLQRALYWVDRTSAKKARAHLTSVFTQYTSFAREDTRERSILRALYYQQIDDLSSREIVATLAADAGQFNDLDEFDAAVRRRQSQIVAARVREEVTELSRAHARARKRQQIRRFGVGNRTAVSDPKAQAVIDFLEKNGGSYAIPYPSSTSRADKKPRLPRTPRTTQNE